MPPRKLVSTARRPPPAWYSGRERARGGVPPGPGRIALEVAGRIASRIDYPSLAGSSIPPGGCDLRGPCEAEHHARHIRRRVRGSEEQRCRPAALGRLHRGSLEPNPTKTRPHAKRGPTSSASRSAATRARGATPSRLGWSPTRDVFAREAPDAGASRVSQGYAEGTTQLSFAAAQLKIRGSPCLSQISGVASGMKKRSLGVSLMFGSVSGGMPWTMKPTR